MRIARYHVYPTDGVIRVPGPLRARVTIEAQNKTRSPTGDDELQYAPLYHYTLDVPAGQRWELAVANAGPLGAALGTNAGVRVVVDAASDLRELIPPILAGRDLPCELGVTALDEAACSVPRPCDPIPPGAMIAMPADMPALITQAARGGLVGTRYFDGLFMTRADLETQQRRLRTEQQLQNRAHGAGVAWGLVPSFNGRSIRVGLGYGIDCCGNDLLVTTTYDVPAEVLLADAAPLIQHGGAGLHLLLEYVEVPEAPRPVHDECAPGISRSEPSRIRETVRLRLVTPRPFDGRGPIDDLLATGLVEIDEVAPQADVPFDLWVRWSGVVMDFLLGMDERQIVVGAHNVELETRNKPGWTLTAATVMADDLSNPAPPVQVGQLDPATGTVRWHIVNGTQTSIEWRARQSGVRGTYAGTTKLTLFVEIDTQEPRLTAEATEVSFTPDAPGPCAHEPCVPKAKLFPTEPPWPHGFPDAPDTAADPRVLELAAAELGISDPIDLNAPTRNAVRDLLGAWCQTLRWRGPTCHGARPHGIVIGCASVRGGRIVSVDPWGGRRWAGRPPLVSHVATQLGFVPPDLVVSKLAALACCAAAQPVPEPPPPVIIERRSPERGPEPLRHRVERSVAARTPPLAPLLRPFAIRLSTMIAASTPIDAIASVEPPVAERLRARMIASVGDLLARGADELLADVGREHATSVARAISGAEDLVDAIARAVGDALSATDASSRAGVERARLGKALVRALKRVPAPIIEAAIAEATA
jgi:hypothetical protein